MNYLQHLLYALVVISCTNLVVAQKVKVGYDKGTDLSKYRTYTWAKPQMQPSRSLLYDYIVSAIDGELPAKGLEPKKTR